MPEPTTPPVVPPPATPPVDHAAENVKLLARIAELEKKSNTTVDPTKDLDLTEKARLEREAKDKQTNNTKALERALTFSLKSEDFLKTNETLLPKDVSDIFRQAEKENYSDAIEKDGAIKAGIVQSFFSVQANVDLLTPALKSQLDEYLKLTKNGKQDKAQTIYDSIFEPTFEMLKRIKKAEALSKGYGGGNDAENEYKKKLMNLTRKHYLGEKN
jgi:hypothetical protein